MDTVVTILQAIGTFTVGLAVRSGIVLAVMAALAAPGLLALAVTRAVRRARRRTERHAH